MAIPQQPHLTKAEKDRLLAAGGALRASLLLVERAGLPARLKGELWAWAADLRMVRGLSAQTTIARYLDAVRGFLEWVRREKLDDRGLELSDFNRWQRELYVERNFSTRYRVTLITAVRGFYRWREEHKLGDNLAANVRGPKLEDPMPRRYTPEQLKRLFGASPPDTPLLVRDRAILAFLLATGARREECAKISVNQIEPRERVMVVRFKGKGAKERDVSVEGEAVELFKAWLALRHRLLVEDTDRVWLSLSNRNRGLPVQVHTIEDAVRRAAKRARLREWGVHRFRVTFASELYDQGVRMEEIRQIMGHESIETTRRYIQVSQRRQKIRLSGDRQGELMGVKPKKIPLWLQHQQGAVDA